MLKLISSAKFQLTLCYMNTIFAAISIYIDNYQLLLLNILAAGLCYYNYFQIKGQENDLK